MPIVALPPYARLRDYETAIRLAGGEPRRLEIGRDDPADVIREVDALLLPGGGDVEPSRYGKRSTARSTRPRAGATSWRLNWRSVHARQTCRSSRSAEACNC
jgi:gamma-glutamyl-gamma-aminobutyrate hydrolase PuuD